MKRREVIEKLAIGSLGSMAIPTLWSCSEDDKVDSVYNGKVAILGAGVSGMYAAYLLNLQGVDVEIYEASDRLGGRIQHLPRFSDFPLELGADEVFGNNNIWYQLIAGQGVPILEREPFLNYVLNDLVGTEEDFSGDPGFSAALNYVRELQNYQGSDITVQSSLNRVGIPSDSHYIVNSMVSNQAGTSNSRLSAKGVSDQIKNAPNNGNGIHILSNQAHESIFKSQFESITGKIRYNTPITSIDYSGEKIQLSDANGGNYEADKVIVTVPISILKDGDISFNPGLPAAKINAINSIGMDPGMKVAISFNGIFWGGQTTSIISDGIVPRYYSPGTGRSPNNLVLAGYIMGEAAEEFANADDQTIVQAVLDDLDRLYNNSASSLASTDIDGNIQAVVKDWSKEPYIRGAYSYNQIGASVSRISYANPINEQIFFAGEAANTNENYGSVNGALEAAEEAVNKLIDAVSTENRT